MQADQIPDLTSLDLETVLLDEKGLNPFLRQVGRFRMLDGVLYEAAEERLTIGYKEISGEDWWAEDHVPGRPMFPGVLQIEAAAQLSSYDFMAHRLDGPLAEDRFVGFGGVGKVRFRRAVVPDCRLILTTQLIKSSRRMFRYMARGFVANEVAFEAEILGVIV